MKRYTGLLLGVFLLTVGAQYVAGQINVLVVGSTRDAGELSWTADSTTSPFNPTAFVTHLTGILNNAGLGAVNVTFEDRYRFETKTWKSVTYTAWLYAYNLASWYHWPYPDNADRNVRWPNLRSEGTKWDYVVLIEDSYTVERIPGMYAQGVAMIGQEVARGTNGTQTVLLMTWPGSNSQSSMNHYKEVNYRIGRSAGYPVAPAGLAFQAATGLSKASGSTHPDNRGAYIAAATLYSRLFNAPAPSAYNPGYNSTQYNNDRNTAYTTVTNNVGQPQYTGAWDFDGHYKMIHDKRRTINYTHRGTSTEEAIASSIGGRLSGVRLNWERGGKSSFPRPLAFNQGRDGITSESSKSYQVNPSEWTAGFGYFYGPRLHYDRNLAGNRVAIAHMHAQDNRLERHMRVNNQFSARNTPLKTLWAEYHRRYSSTPPVIDTSNHLPDEANRQASSFIVTMFSGRTPMGRAPDPMSSTWWSMKIGYEAAWRMSHLVTRAPGFRTLPSAASVLSVTPTSTETMDVLFVLKPRTNVTVHVTAVPESAVTITPRILHFTPDNHDTTQRLRFRGMPGASASQSFNVEFRTESGDVVYDGLYDEWGYRVTRSETQAVNVVEGPTHELYCLKNGSVGVEPGAGATAANTIITGPILGTVDWGDGTLVYTPPQDFLGSDSFAFTVQVGDTVTRTYVLLTVMESTVEMRGNAVAIAPGDTSPAVEDGTDFGMIQNSGPVLRTFTVHNVSDDVELDLVNNPRVTITGGNGYFTLAQDTTTNTLAPGAHTSFALSFQPEVAGNFSATITVENSDPIFGSYSFRVAGARVQSPSVANQPASAIGNKSARMHGVLTGGYRSDATIYWGTSNGGTTPGNWTNTRAFSGITGEFSFLADGLLPGTTYYYRSYVSNPAGSGWAPDTASFTTLTYAPAFLEFFELPIATETDPYAVDLLDAISDEDLPHDAFTFEKLSGPAWLSLAESGQLSGTPVLADVGTHTLAVRVTDTYGNAVETTLELLVEGLTVLPFVEPFESPQVVQGGINWQNGWVEPSDQGQVQRDVKFDGDQALLLNYGTEATQRFSPNTNDVVWIDTRVRLENLRVLDPMFVPKEGHVSWFVNADGHITVLNGNEWLVLTNHTPIGTLVWHRVTLALDYSAQTWSIYLNGALLMNGLPLAGSPDKLKSLRLTGESSFMDNLSVQYTQPAGIAVDGKGFSTISVSGPTQYVYNGAQQGPDSISVTGSGGAITFSYTGTEQTFYGPSSSKPVDAGTYRVNATVAEDDDYVGASSLSYLFTIAPTTIAVTPDASQSKLTSAPDPELTYTHTAAIVGETPLFTGALERAAGETSGLYAITQGTLEIADNGAFKASNYSLVFVSGVNFIISDKTISTIVVTGATSFVYNASGQGPDTATVTGSAGARTYSYFGTGNAGSSYGPSALKPVNAGSYHVIATVAEDASHSMASSLPYAFSIVRAVPTVSDWAQAGSIRVGESLAAAALSGGSASVPGTFVFVNPNAEPAAPGLYTADVRFVPTDSHNFATAEGTVEVLVLGFASIPFTETFEERTPGDLHAQNNWSAQGVVVQSDVSNAPGLQAARIERKDGYMRQAFSGAATTVWIDLYIQPVFFADDIGSVNPDATVLFFFNADGQLVVYDGMLPTVLTNVSAASTGEWVRASVKSDYVARTWDLFLNGTEVATNLAFYNVAAESYSALQVEGAHSDASAYVDDIRVMLASPFGSNATLTVITAHGIATPGTGVYPTGTEISASLAGSPDTQGTTRYVATGWIGTGDVPASGSTTNVPVFTINQDSTLHWNWATNYWIEIRPARGE
jgi:hypothetical protein